MARGKERWFVRLMHSHSIYWTCVGTPDSEYIARVVAFGLSTDNGREITLQLTPDQARAKGAELIRTANAVDTMNRFSEDDTDYDKFGDRFKPYLT